MFGIGKPSRSGKIRARKNGRSPLQNRRSLLFTVYRNVDGLAESHKYWPAYPPSVNQPTPLWWSGLQGERAEPGYIAPAACVKSRFGSENDLRRTLWMFETLRVLLYLDRRLLPRTNRTNITINQKCYYCVETTGLLHAVRVSSERRQCSRVHPKSM